jgi:hypothetical protein
MDRRTFQEVVELSKKFIGEQNNEITTQRIAQDHESRMMELSRLQVLINTRIEEASKKARDEEIKRTERESKMAASRRTTQLIQGKIWNLHILNLASYQNSY